MLATGDVRDRFAALTRRSGLWIGTGRWPTFGATISADGRYVAFASIATNIVRSGVSKRSQVYLYDTEREESELVSRTPLGTPGNGDSSMSAVAGSGRFVVFQSVASDLTCALRCTPGERDDNLVSDVFVLDRQTSRMQRLSRDRAASAGGRRALVRSWMPQVACLLFPPATRQDQRTTELILIFLS